MSVFPGRETFLDTQPRPYSSGLKRSSNTVYYWYSATTFDGSQRMRGFLCPRIWYLRAYPFQGWTQGDFRGCPRRYPDH
jgi:hypothetical protein